MIGFGYVVMMFVLMLKFFSFFLIRCDVNLSVLVEIVFCVFGVGLSSDIGGSVELFGRLVNSGIWCLCLMCLDFVGVMIGGMIVIGLWFLMCMCFFLILFLWCIVVVLLSLWLCLVLWCSFVMLMVDRIVLLMCLVIDSYEKWKYSDRLIVSVISSNSVLFVKLNVCDIVFVMVLLMMLFGVCGNCIFSDYMCSVLMLLYVSMISMNVKILVS